MGEGARPRRRSAARRHFYWDRFTEAERGLVAGAGHPMDTAPGTLDEEIELLRVLIHRVLEERREGPADPEAAGRLVDRLGRLYRTRAALTGGGGAAAEVELIARAADRALAEGRDRATTGGAT